MSNTVELINNTETTILDIRKIAGLNKITIINSIIEELKFDPIEGLEVVIENCPNLRSITNVFLNKNNDNTPKCESVRIGKECGSIKNLSLGFFKNVIIEDQNFDKMEHLYLLHNDNISFDIERCSHLQTFCCYHVNAADLVVNSDNIFLINIGDCNTNSIHIKGDNVGLEFFKLLNIKGELKIDNQLANLNYMSISKPNDTFPILPLPSNLRRDLKIQLDKHTTYLSQLNEFMNDNKEKVSIKFLDDSPFDREQLMISNEVA